MKKPSYRKSIDLMCKQCIYDPIGGKGTWREQVAACTAPKCALFNLRPLPEYMAHPWQDAKKKQIVGSDG